ncbi:hypothetical protein QLX08_010757 [Tetragonisca angustula]|uniref:Uncharacterized protein n=1 Tax=Tetragonisca angustula TaxID=166442 RepID=A0AAW0ZDS2_9HYME
MLMTLQKINIIEFANRYQFVMDDEYRHSHRIIKEAVYQEIWFHGTMAFSKLKMIEQLSHIASSKHAEVSSKPVRSNSGTTQDYSERCHPPGTRQNE